MCLTKTKCFIQNVTRFVLPQLKKQNKNIFSDKQKTECLTLFYITYRSATKVLLEHSCPSDASAASAMPTAGAGIGIGTWAGAWIKWDNHRAACQWHFLVYHGFDAP
ncbi:hypothetical protein GDO81_011881 [Engystomops pustulosus]|uniref:Uncharacterized protein n=1 Tax=Engystomops pustulosus TaxID=76066 RepID=A0AAV7BI61_ENGPU|nr:hypothetical protein GDO81_011881 [Engystomops pustulosus]